MTGFLLLSVSFLMTAFAASIWFSSAIARQWISYRKGAIYSFVFWVPSGRGSKSKVRMSSAYGRKIKWNPAGSTTNPSSSFSSCGQYDRWRGVRVWGQQSTGAHSQHKHSKQGSGERASVARRTDLGTEGNEAGRGLLAVDEATDGHLLLPPQHLLQQRGQRHRAAFGRLFVRVHKVPEQGREGGAKQPKT